MSDETRRPVGRPRKAEGERKRNNLTLRIRDVTREQLGAAAAANSRSLSEEAEARIEHSFQSQDLMPEIMYWAFGSRLSPILQAVGYTMRRAGFIEACMETSNLDHQEDWVDLPGAYQAAADSCRIIIDALSPDNRNRILDYIRELPLDTDGVTKALSMLLIIAGGSDERFPPELVATGRKVREALRIAPVDMESLKRQVALERKAKKREPPKS